MTQSISLLAKVRQLAAADPDRLAVTFRDTELAFKQLLDRAQAVGQGLITAGLRSQTRVGMLAKNSPVFYEVLLGAGSADMVLVPINYRLAPEELAFILADAEVEILFVSSEFAAVAAQIQASLPRLHTLIVIDKEEDYPRWRDGQARFDVLANPIADHVALQMYTSGTTGLPKGALLTHANLAAALSGASATWGPWQSDDVIFVCMPQYHIGASMWGMVGLWQGVHGVLAREFVPAEVLEAIERYRVTKIQLAAVMIRMILDDPGYATTDLSSLRLIIYGASTAPIELIRRARAAFGCGIAQGYGMTETSGAITYLTPDDHAQEIGDRLASVGRAIDGVEIRIVDTAGSTVSAGVVGEVCCRGAQVTSSYWKLPEASAESLREAWFHTGDAGRIDVDGYLTICDRVKDMIISGGENIYPAEVEAVLSEHPLVAEVAVIGAPHERWGEVPHAIVVLHDGAQVSSADLIRHVEGRIARYKVPRIISYAVALPRNASGKVLKRELRSIYQTQDERRP